MDVPNLSKFHIIGDKPIEHVDFKTPTLAEGIDIFKQSRSFEEITSGSVPGPHLVPRIFDKEKQFYFSSMLTVTEMRCIGGCSGSALYAHDESRAENIHIYGFTHATRKPPYRRARRRQPDYYVFGTDAFSCINTVNQVFHKTLKPTSPKDLKPTPGEAAMTLVTVASGYEVEHPDYSTVQNPIKIQVYSRNARKLPDKNRKQYAIKSSQNNNLPTPFVWSQPLGEPATVSATVLNGAEGVCHCTEKHRDDSTLQNSTIVQPIQSEQMTDCSSREPVTEQLATRG